jgi:hypothetical protein
MGYTANLRMCKLGLKEVLSGYQPSMKSLVSIFTRLGLSLLPLSWSAVTIGYLANSSDISWGKMSVLCCQWLSLGLFSAARGLWLEKHLTRGWRPFCIRNGSEECERHGRCANSCLNNCATIGESI